MVSLFYATNNLHYFTDSCVFVLAVVFLHFGDIYRYSWHIVVDLVKHCSLKRSTCCISLACGNHLRDRITSATIWTCMLTIKPRRWYIHLLAEFVFYSPLLSNYCPVISYIIIYVRYDLVSRVKMTDIDNDYPFGHLVSLPFPFWFWWQKYKHGVTCALALCWIISNMFFRLESQCGNGNI